jgi:hypothetical protein
VTASNDNACVRIELIFTLRGEPEDVDCEAMPLWVRSTKVLGVILGPMQLLEQLRIYERERLPNVGILLPDPNWPKEMSLVPKCTRAYRGGQNLVVYLVQRIEDGPLLKEVIQTEGVK